MRSPWSPLPNLSIATVAISHFNVAEAATTHEPGRAVAISDILMLTSTADAWMQVNAWLGDSYHRAPALMLVLAVLIALPPLAVAGLVLRRQRRSPDSTVLIARPSRRAGNGAATVRTELAAWPTEAWIEVGDQKFIVGRAMLRVGREADNDICLQEKTVHRYHAVIRRTTDGEVIVTDLSGPDGNGVLINGTRIAEGKLKRGDVIAIGEVKMSFNARPI